MKVAGISVMEVERPKSAVLLDEQLDRLVTDVAPELSALPGIGTDPMQRRC